MTGSGLGVGLIRWSDVTLWFIGLNHIWDKKGVWPGHVTCLHCRPFYWSSLISKGFILVSRQSLTSGKFHYPTPLANQSCAYQPEWEGTGNITHFHCKSVIGILP